MLNVNNSLCPNHANLNMVPVSLDEGTAENQLHLTDILCAWPFAVFVLSWAAMFVASAAQSAEIIAWDGREFSLPLPLRLPPYIIANLTPRTTLSPLWCCQRRSFFSLYSNFDSWESWLLAFMNDEHLGWECRECRFTQPVFQSIERESQSCLNELGSVSNITCFSMLFYSISPAQVIETMPPPNPS